MAHGGPDADYVRGRGTAVTPRRLAGASRTLGVGLLGAALPALVVTLAAGPGVADPMVLAGWVAGAMDTALVAGGGLPWAFHVAVFASLVGTWLIGLALVVEGYFGLYSSS